MDAFASALDAATDIMNRLMVPTLANTPITGDI